MVSFYFTSKKALIYLVIALFLTSCGGGFFKKMDARNTPQNALERAKKNVKEGRGVSIQGLAKNRRGGEFVFSSSNPMWRASLETLDTIPLSTVDYSGGIIITDWYSDSNSANDAIKITLRFLTNEIRSDSIKIIVHKRRCVNNNCNVQISKSKIEEVLRETILKQATLFEKQDKEKNKN